MFINTNKLRLSTQNLLANKVQTALVRRTTGYNLKAALRAAFKFSEPNWTQINIKYFYDTLHLYLVLVGAVFHHEFIERSLCKGVIVFPVFAVYFSCHFFFAGVHHFFVQGL